MADTLEDFLAAYAAGVLDGIRPDQVQFIEGLQPFDTAFISTGPPVLQFLRRLTEQPHPGNVVTAWAHLAKPEVIVEPPSVAEIFDVEPDGPITTSNTIATFLVTHLPDLVRRDWPRIYGNPNVTFDFVLAVGSTPTGPDDPWSRRFKVYEATKAEC